MDRRWWLANNGGDDDDGGGSGNPHGSGSGDGVPPIADPGGDDD